jgi:glutaredoxin
MIDITKEELELKINNKDNFIVYFNSLYCDDCIEGKKLLQSKNVECFSVCVDNEEEYFMEMYKLDVIPEVRSYRFGNVVWSHLGKLDEQIAEVTKRHEINNSTI